MLFGNSKQAKCMSKVLKFEGVETDVFCVDAEHKKEDTFLGKPLYSTEQFLSECSPNDYIAFLPVGAVDRCNFRKKKFFQFQEAGYDFFTFISRYSILYTNIKNIGTNVYIGSCAILHPDVVIGDNCYISEGAKIGHDTQIKPHCFVGPHTCMCGAVKLGERVMVGVGALIREKVEIAEGSIVGMGVAIHKSIEKAGVYVVSPVIEEHYNRHR